MSVSYVAGSLMGGGSHRITLNLLRSNIERATATLLCRFVENWCFQQCTGLWSVEVNDFDFVVAFDDAQDAVIFRLTKEFDYMTEHACIAA